MGSPWPYLIITLSAISFIVYEGEQSFDAKTYLKQECHFPDIIIEGYIVVHQNDFRTLMKTPIPQRSCPTLEINYDRS